LPPSLEILSSVGIQDWDFPTFAEPLEIQAPGKKKMTKGGGNSNAFYFDPELWGNDPI